MKGQNSISNMEFERSIRKSVQNIVITPSYEGILKRNGVERANHILLNQVIHLLNRADRKGEGYDKIIEYMRDVHVWIKNIEGVRKVD